MGMNKAESTFVRHMPCERCGSSDGNALYSDGHTYCFVCQTYVKADGKVRNEGGSEVSRDRANGLIQNVTPVELRKRKISLETCKKYGYGVTQYKGRTVQVAPYYMNGRLVAQHLRNSDKQFVWVGNFSKKMDLFGQHLWGNGGQRIVITEGEIDCLSVAQAFNLRWPVVSVPNGAQSAKTHIQQHLEYLESFNEVVIAFDNDEEGRKAANECAMLFTPGKVKIANWAPYKDANEMLQAVGGAKIVDTIFQAKTYRPDGIVAARDISLEDLLTEEDPGYTTEFTKLNEMLRGIRKAEITTFGAGTGIGKSTMVRQIAYHLAKRHGLRIGYVALEESIKKSLLGFMAYELGVPMGDLVVDRSIVSQEEFERAYNEIVNSDRFYFYDHFGSLDGDNLMSKLRYLTTGLNVDFIVLDHLSIVISGVEDGDERRMIDNLMTNLRSLVENTGVGMLLVSHLKVPQGSRAHEEGGRVTLNDFRGSGAIKQLSDNIIGLERDQQGDEPDVTTVRLLKNRLFGVTGVADRLKWNAEKGVLEVEEEEFDEFFADDQEDDDDVPF